MSILHYGALALTVLSLSIGFFYMLYSILELRIGAVICVYSLTILTFVLLTIGYYRFSS